MVTFVLHRFTDEFSSQPTALHPQGLPNFTSMDATLTDATIGSSFTFFPNPKSESLMYFRVDTFQDLEK